MIQTDDVLDLPGVALLLQGDAKQYPEPEVPLISKSIITVN
jgi:hypothetical protein